jgi:UDP-2,3-diacylglucosamine hydrolase
MKSIFFISDVHLGLHEKGREKEKEQRLLSFLSHVEEHGEQLFIVGDLFDYWFEYKHVIPRGYHHTISKLGMLVEKGVKVHYVAGNHDFWLKDFFPNDLGIPVYKNPFAMTLRGKKFFFHHGDGLALRDTGYRILKTFLRNKLSIFLFSLMHPGITAPIAKSTSRSSRAYTANKDYGETDGMLQFATKKIHDGCDVVIMGHRHVPSTQKIGHGIYINLGDWISYSTYAEFNGDTVELKTWEKK